MINKILELMREHGLSEFELGARQLQDSPAEAGSGHWVAQRQRTPAMSRRPPPRRLPPVHLHPPGRWTRTWSSRS
jgi:hypothetical protein